MWPLPFRPALRSSLRHTRLRWSALMSCYTCPGWFAGMDVETEQDLLWIARKVGQCAPITQPPMRVADVSRTERQRPALYTSRPGGSTLTACASNRHRCPIRERSGGRGRPSFPPSNMSQGCKQPLPPGFKACQTRDTGDIYYFNFETVLPPTTHRRHPPRPTNLSTTPT